MTEQTFRVKPSVLASFRELLNEQARELPNAVGNSLWNSQPYKSFTVVSDQPTEYKLCSLLGGDYLVISADNENQWYVDSAIADSTLLFPRIESTPFDDESDVAEEYVFDENSPLSGETSVAKYEPDPVGRVDSEIEVTHLTIANTTGVPYEWFGLTASDEPFYLRERSGSIKARVGGEYGVDGEIVYRAFIGGEFPGTNLNKAEIISTVGALDFISINSNLPNVPDRRFDEIYGAMLDDTVMTDEEFDDIVDELDDGFKSND